VWRPLLLIVVLLAIPAVASAAFGGPEVADPHFFVDDTIPEQLQVDAAGRAYFVNQAEVPAGDPEDAETDRQVVVHERCGTAWQVDSRRRIVVGEAQGIADGVHGGNDSRSEVVASGPSPSCSGGTVTPTPTPSATATAIPTATATAIPTPGPNQGQQGRGGDQGGTVDVIAPRGKLLRVAFYGGKVWIRLRLGEEATVTFRLDGKRLAKRNLRAGTRNVALKPRTELRRGRHKLTATAVDNAGNRSRVLAKRFRVG
jgi:hypothetical protein